MPALDELLEYVRCPKCMSTAIQFVQGCLRCQSCCEQSTTLSGGIRGNAVNGMIPEGWQKELAMPVVHRKQGAPEDRSGLSGTQIFHLKKRGQL
jgi:hypothetical protein